MKRRRKQTQTIDPLHKYQLVIVLMFICGFILLFPYYVFLLQYKLEIAQWQWYFLIPWSLIFIVYGLYARSKIPRRAFSNIKKHHILHWIVLGLLLLLFQISLPTNMERMYGLNIVFYIFTIFLADSYWDIKPLTSIKRR